jgi:Ser/Thr protein kinase RdoA (MazF antagonist)
MPVTDAELADTLEATLGRRPLELARRPHAYRTSYETEELEVRLENGAPPLRLLLKDVSASGLSDVARIKPPFLHDPLREIEVYAGPLADEDGPPRYLGSVVDPANERYALLLELVDGRELFQVGELELWEEAARWLAGFHGRHPEPAAPRLIRWDDAHLRLWLDRAQDFTGAAELVPIAAGYERVLDRLRALPAVLAHGEFYASNVLIRNRTDRVCPVDWEMAALAPGLVDLAALTTGDWSDRERGAIEAAYREALAPELREPLEAAGFDAALDCCRLQLALQWLGWSEDWRPPADRAHDWLAEALAAWERIEA